jgi:hypothetical protein
LTSSCEQQRKKLITDTLYSIKDQSASDECWLAFKCITNTPISHDPICFNLCKNRMCVTIIEKECPSMMFIPAVPVLFNDIYFAYNRNDSQYLADRGVRFPYVCYNNSHYDEFLVNASKVLFNNVTCYRFQHSLTISSSQIAMWNDHYLTPTHTATWKYNLIFNYSSAICNSSNMYQCAGSSKRISIYRIMNGIDDCPRSDDENNIIINSTDMIEHLKRKYVKCEISNKYISQSLIADGKCDCGYIEPNWCEDENLNINYIKRNISFQTICDKGTELYPVIIDGQNETDETECEQWPCNNLYNYCDGFWNCPNGIDEIGCDILPSLDCSLDHHTCVTPNTHQIICLPMSRVNDGTIDCLGASDERNRCYSVYNIRQEQNFYCFNGNSTSCITYTQLCDGVNDCLHGDDEQFCNKNRTLSIYETICFPYSSTIRLDVEQFLCKSMQYRLKAQAIYFSLDGVNNAVRDLTKPMENTNLPTLTVVPIPHQNQPRCHRGLDLRVWMDSETNLTTTSTCLCPPSFYGIHVKIKINE